MSEYEHLWENRWSVWRRYVTTGMERGEIDDEGQQWYRATGQEFVGYSVGPQEGGGEEVEFGIDQEDEAVALAAEFNRFERQGPLPLEFESRRRNLAKLPGSLFNVKYGEYPWNDSPAEPKRYATITMNDRYSGEAFIDLFDDLDSALEEIAGEGGGELFDLDTGSEIPVEVNATVTL